MQIVRHASMFIGKKEITKQPEEQMQITTNIDYVRWRSAGCYNQLWLDNRAVNSDEKNSFISYSVHSEKRHLQAEDTLAGRNEQVKIGSHLMNSIKRKISICIYGQG